MIVKVTKIKANSNSNKSAFHSVVYYHFNKVKDGVAEIIHNGGFLDNELNPQDIITEYDSLINDYSLMNSHKLENYGVDISFNFPINEIPDDEILLNIINDFAKSFNYETTNFICFKHVDKDHFHIHFLAPQINELIERNSFLDGLYKNDVLDFSRLIEQKYKLTEVGKSSNKIKSFQKYKYSVAFKRMWYTKEGKEFLSKELTGKQIKLLFKNKLDDKAVTELLKENNIVLSKLNETIKDTPFERGRRKIIELSKNSTYSTVKELKSYYESNNYYFRYIHNEGTIVISENQNPVHKKYFYKFHISDLFDLNKDHFKDNKLVHQSETRKKIRSIFKDELLKSITFNEFIINLKKNGIQISIDKKSTELNYEGVSYLFEELKLPKISSIEKKFNNRKEQTIKIKSNINYLPKGVSFKPGHNSKKEEYEHENDNFFKTNKGKGMSI